MTIAERLTLMATRVIPADHPDAAVWAIAIGTGGIASGNACTVRPRPRSMGDVPVCCFSPVSATREAVTRPQRYSHSDPLRRQNSRDRTAAVRRPTDRQESTRSPTFPAARWLRLELSLGFGCANVWKVTERFWRRAAGARAVRDGDAQMLGASSSTAAEGDTSR
jgi:hypothetical protein